MAHSIAVSPHLRAATIQLSQRSTPPARAARHTDAWGRRTGIGPEGDNPLYTMISLTSLVGPMALLLAPVAPPHANDAPVPGAASMRDAGPTCGLSGEEQAAQAGGLAEDRRIMQFRRWQIQINPQQTQVQQRFVLRISPRSRTAPLPPQMPTRVVEQKMGKCIAVNSIVAVQTRGANDLVLYTRDRQMISAELEKSCSARDFYSGFYVEPSKDGKLCIKRDKLQSRNGAKCEISKFARLVAA